MPTFDRCPKLVEDLALNLCRQFHESLLLAKVKIDYVFAFADKDEKTGLPTNNALSKNGIRALGIARKIGLKDRALDRGDAEISLDGDHWEDSSDAERAALLDHELQHIAVKTDKHGNIQFDDLGRPKIEVRKHDVEIGWFNAVAQRHAAASIERIQAKKIMDHCGQYYWPELAPTVTISTVKQSVTVPSGRFSQIAKDMAKSTPESQ